MRLKLSSLCRGFVVVKLLVVWSSVGLWVGLVCVSEVFTLRWFGLDWVTRLTGCVEEIAMDPRVQLWSVQVQTWRALGWCLTTWWTLQRSIPTFCSCGCGSIVSRRRSCTSCVRGVRGPCNPSSSTHDFPVNLRIALTISSHLISSHPVPN